MCGLKISSRRDWSGFFEYRMSSERFPWENGLSELYFLLVSAVGVVEAHTHSCLSEVSGMIVLMCIHRQECIMCRVE